MGQIRGVKLGRVAVAGVGAGSGARLPGRSCTLRRRACSAVHGLIPMANEVGSVLALDHCSQNAYLCDKSNIQRAH
jgi:hypothetical protein